MPLTWAQVRNGLAPERFTIRTVPGLLAKTSAWAEYGESLGKLGQAIERLGKI
jgi:bifunctional non-homologous end joining protein LigD